MPTLPACAARVPIFQVLPEEALLELSEAMHHRTYAKGDLVAASGDPVRDLLIVAQGRLDIVHSTAGGRSQVVRSLGPGESLGELALFSPARHEGDVIAIAETRVCSVSREAVQATMARHPAAALRLVESLAQRLARAEQLAADLSLRDVGQRLAAELLRAAGIGPLDADRTWPAEPLQVQLDIPYSELAARLGTTPESVSRRLKALADQGILLQKQGRTLVIINPQRLKELAEI